MKLITEAINEPVELIVEEINGKKNFFIEGVFMQADVLNKNRRKYPREILSREANRYVTEMVNTNRAVGELGHPNSPAINLDKISHKIISLHEDGNNWIGKAKLLDTPMGKIAQNLTESDIQLGVSSRGLGTLKAIHDGSTQYNQIQEDFRLATAADIVYDPSAPSAFVNGIMEGVEWIYQSDVTGGRFIEKAKHMIDESVVQRTKEAIALVLFERFLNNITLKHTDV